MAGLKICMHIYTFVKMDTDYTLQGERPSLNVWTVGRSLVLLFYLGLSIKLVSYFVTTGPTQEGEMHAHRLITISIFLA